MHATCKVLVCTVLGYNMTFSSGIINTKERMKRTVHIRHDQKKIEWGICTVHSLIYVYTQYTHTYIFEYLMPIFMCMHNGNGSTLRALLSNLYNMACYHIIIHTSLNIRIQLYPNQQRHTTESDSHTHILVHMPPCRE